jgi:hypothetical protein
MDRSSEEVPPPPTDRFTQLPADLKFRRTGGDDAGHAARTTEMTFMTVAVQGQRAPTGPAMVLLSISCRSPCLPIVSAHNHS